MFFSIQNVRSQSFIFLQSRCMLVSNKQEANNPRTQTKPKTELSLHLKSRLRVKMEVEVKTPANKQGQKTARESCRKAISSITKRLNNECHKLCSIYCIHYKKESA